MPKNDKSGFLARAGYTRDRFWELQNDIRCQLLPAEAALMERNQFGEFYELGGTLNDTLGSIHVRTIWLHDMRGNVKLITLIPGRGKP